MVPQLNPNLRLKSVSEFQAQSALRDRRQNVRPQLNPNLRLTSVSKFEVQTVLRDRRLIVRPKCAQMGDTSTQPLPKFDECFEFEARNGLGGRRRIVRPLI